MHHELFEKVEAWIADDVDETTQEQTRQVLADARNGDASALEQLQAWFGPFLQFGTAGLRGPLGPGPSCMNRAVVIRAAAGLCAYLNQRDAKRIVVGYDARHRSHDFALDTVAIAAAAGLEAILLPRALPTPVLAFAVRHLDADAGVMVTASHNPAQDNGYKVYLGDGSQIVPPADADIAAEISKITSASAVAMSDAWLIAEESVVTEYINRAAHVVAGVRVPVNVVSTSLHGVGHEVWSSVFHQAQLGTLTVVAEQQDPDPDFPTVAFPNPEEAGATDLLLELAAKVDADVAIAHDPDADRCAVGIKTESGAWRLLRGDELGALLADWTFMRAKTRFNLPTPEGSVAASIVSSRLIAKIAEANNVPCHFTLTGFKWISKIPDLIFGYEEALGYCVDPASVRDKDGISAAARVCEMVSYYKSHFRDLQQVLDAQAREYGVYATDQLSVRMNDLAQIPAAVAKLRANPPRKVGGLAVTEFVDLSLGYNGLPPTDGVMLLLDGGRVIARPSGTEPKLKCYLEAIVKTNDVDADRRQAQRILDSMKTDMKAVFGV